MHLPDFKNSVGVPDVPLDFRDFWDRQLSLESTIPIDFERTPDSAMDTDTHTVEWIRFLSFNGEHIFGWLATPRSALGHVHRGLVWLPGYSYGNPKPGPDTLYPDTVTLGLNVHGNTPDYPYEHPRRLGGEYITEGITSPETYIYRRIVLHCIHAVTVLKQLPEVQSDRIVVGGMSQGGGLALIVAALRLDVAACLADMPWLCNLTLALSLIDPDRYPIGRPGPDSRARIRELAQLDPKEGPAIYRTFSYFDPLSHADQMVCPVDMSAGGKDPSCRAPTIYSVYNRLPVEKNMLYLGDTGHQIVPEMHTSHSRWVDCHVPI